MEGKIILNQVIIDKVKSKSGTGSKGFTYPKLMADLLEFIEQNKNLVGKDICQEFPMSAFVDDKKFRWALSRKDGDSNAGAIPGLRDLLCFYAFGKTWKDTIETEIKTTITDEIQEDNQIKGRKPRELSDEIKIGFEQTHNRLQDLKSIMEQQFGNIAEVMKNAHDQSTDKNSEYAKAREAYCKCAETEDWEGMLSPLETMTTKMDETIEQLIEQQCFYLTQMLVQFMEVHRYSDVIESSRRLSKLRPLDPMQNFWTASAYFELGEYQEAISHIKKTKEIEPHDAHSISLELNCYVHLNRYDEILPLCDDTLNLLAKKKLYQLAWTLSIGGFRLTYEREPVDQKFVKHLLLLKFSALHESDAPSSDKLKGINQLLSVDDDIVYKKMKVMLLKDDPFKFILYCEACIKKHPKEPYFLLHLCAALTQTKQPKKVILKRVKQLCKLDDAKAKKELTTDKAFECLWGDPDFKKIINTDYSKPSSWKFW